MKSTCHVQRVHVQEVSCFLLVAALIANVVPVHCNYEVDILNLWKTQLVDPNNELQSWDPTLVNPCTWLHVTCNIENRVTRVDLGSAGLSGTLTPQLGNLSYLQYFEVYDNNLYGSIPKELGNLKNLVSLDLYENQLNGSIPNTLGGLKSLRFARLNNNKLTGKLPIKLISLIFWGRLTILDVANNQLDGTVHSNANATVTTIIRDPKA